MRGMKKSWRFGTFVAVVAMLTAGTLVMASESAFGANGPERPAGRCGRRPSPTSRLPGAGCFTASYPALEWHATQCKVAPASAIGTGSWGIYRRQPRRSQPSPLVTATTTRLW